LQQGSCGTPCLASCRTQLTNAAMMVPSMLRYAKFALAFGLSLLAAADSTYQERCITHLRSIFSGVSYGCKLLKRSEEGHGTLHWVRVDLTAPGMELYVTPLDASAGERGFQYRLRWISDVVRNERLAVAINGSLFTSTPAWRPGLPGDFANGVETVVSDHVTSHFWEHTYLLWFDDDLNAHLRPSKPPSLEDLRKAKWGIGGQGVGLRDGKVWAGIDRTPNSRTAVGIDSERKVLFLTVAEWASPRLILEELAKEGARDAMLLDGGSSSAMAINKGSQYLPSQALLGGWRPVATFFGVRARQLNSP
jgi:hypothetical protein